MGIVFSIMKFLKLTILIFSFIGFVSCVKPVFHSDLIGKFQEVFDGEKEYIKMVMNDSITTEYITQPNGQIDVMKSKIVWIDSTSCYSFLYYSSNQIFQDGIHPKDTCQVEYTLKKGNKIFFKIKNTYSLENQYISNDVKITYRKGYLKKLD